MKDKTGAVWSSVKRERAQLAMCSRPEWGLPNPLPPLSFMSTNNRSIRPLHTLSFTGLHANETTAHSCILQRPCLMALKYEHMCRAGELKDTDVVNHPLSGGLWK